MTGQKGRSGGRRPGAGRPRGSGPYGEATRRISVPESLAPGLQALLASLPRTDVGPTDPAIDRLHRLRSDAPALALTLYAARVQAGFPSPADDYVEGQLDLNEYFIEHPAATFYVRVSGDSMIEAGIQPGDVLIVDRAVEPTHGRIIIAVVNGELTVKRLYQKNNRVRLLPENSRYPPIEITDDSQFTVWGVVTGVARKL